MEHAQRGYMNTTALGCDRDFLLLRHTRGDCNFVMQLSVLVSCLSKEN